LRLVCGASEGRVGTGAPARILVRIDEVRAGHFRHIPAGDIGDPVEAGYERVEEVGAFQIYVRRGSAAAGAT